MALHFRPMDEDGARTLLSWRYEPPYHIYHLDLMPTQLVDAVVFLTDRDNLYYRIDNDMGELEAFCCFGLDAQVNGGAYATDALDLGLGVRPDLTGQGRGSTYTTAVCNFAVQTFAPTKLRVTIAEFNQRAQHAWAKAGFVQSYAFRSAHGARPFVVLTRAAIPPPA